MTMPDGREEAISNAHHAGEGVGGSVFLPVAQWEVRRIKGCRGRGGPDGNYASVFCIFLGLGGRAGSK